MQQLGLGVLKIYSMKKAKIVVSILSWLSILGCTEKEGKPQNQRFVNISKEVLKDKIKGAWAAQTIGVTYGGPTEFHYTKKIIPDSVLIHWSDTTLLHAMTKTPGLYDDIYMDLTFVEVLERQGLNASAEAHVKAYAEARYWLWHANQQGRYNYIQGLKPPKTGHWMNNPHADDIDFQIEADFIGIMYPGMPNAALQLCDRVGHIMNSGDGYYGGVFVAAMYSHAFVMDSIPMIVNNALQSIPEESTFYQCIADVIQWHSEHSKDWKVTWNKVEDKWGTDIGCPSGVFRNYNIDAKINAAYVVMGLLYGDGELGKTMEIATRCGQDSDCNPATAGAIVGTIFGYDRLPEKWSKGLAAIENMDFIYTQTSLNEVYDISYRHALEAIENNGGVVTEDSVEIKLQKSVAAPLEQNFEGHALAKRKSIDKTIKVSDIQEYQMDFEGIGLVLTGRAWNTDLEDQYSLETNAETLGDYRMQVDFLIDGKLAKTMELPLDFVERSYELFFQYALKPGKHQLTLKVKNPKDKAHLEIRDLITYNRHI